jgi:Taurine catabolism dioxygenase TauD, TfdA family
LVFLRIRGHYFYDTPRAVNVTAEDRCDRRARACAQALSASGFVTIEGPFATAREAFDSVAALLGEIPVDPGFPPLEVIGEFVIPPIPGPPSRDFQTLHFDFGLPLDPVVSSDVARFTALHIHLGAAPSRARTRLVPLHPLLRQATWPERRELLVRLTAYGETHGAFDQTPGYTEGSLARIVEAAAGGEPQLPSVKTTPGFLCGNEFASLNAELVFFDAHGLSVSAVDSEVTIRPGAVLIFDNLALAHGRSGVRQPGELHQRVFGHRALDPDRQRLLRDQVLATFDH